MDKSKLIKTHADDLLKQMIEKYELDVKEEDGMHHINIKTDDEAPTIIGRHGETIRAIQKILEVILFKETGEKVDLLVNINDYREKQQERLEYIASQAAQKVQSMRKPSYLRGFSSYERKIMHENITKNYADLTTYSMGEGRDRRLVIEEKGSVQPTDDVGE